jgi:hypothetical protein
MITIIPIEPINDEHALLIIEAFNRHFVNRGGQEDGHGDGGGGGGGGGDGYGYGFGGDGFGYGYGGADGEGVSSIEAPKEWQLIDENNQALTGGQNQEMLRDKKK